MSSRLLPLIFVIVFKFITLNTFAQDSIISPQTIDSSKINFGRLAIVGGISTTATVGSYFYYKKAWWSDQATGFHFDTGRDLLYAKNLDKYAHFMGGMVTSEMFRDMLLWANIPEKKAVWSGAGFGSFIQLSIEIKDGFAPRWGFSTWDVAMGSIGSLYPVAQYYWEPISYFDFKFSYYKRTNRYFEFNKNGHAIDDYINQTYWIATNPADFAVGLENKKWWPSFLGLAFGVSLDEETNGKGAGNFEYYFALDYDFNRVLKKKNSPTWKAIKKYLNYIKFPGPAIRLTPTGKYFYLYM